MTDPAEVLLPPSETGIPITLIAAGEWEKTRRRLNAGARAWCESNGFQGQPGRSLAVPGSSGTVD